MVCVIASVKVCSHFRMWRLFEQQKVSGKTRGKLINLSNSFFSESLKVVDFCSLKNHFPRVKRVLFLTSLSLMWFHRYIRSCTICNSYKRLLKNILQQLKFILPLNLYKGRNNVYEVNIDPLDHCMSLDILLK